ncbi:MAG: tetratricopeptide repeat protein [Leptospiraceae bacterium]|nr:tetratricopeptide repeat protein [Leptospiraceae bacterium]MCK6380093.1 tetratricopeptide repeat protein [Leptospiraceae bacterium]NUM42676.1 tetratricopeptide repeat protein [Leptospiraceae bacterium]
MITKEMEEVVKHYNLGLQCYKERKFEDALKFFREALQVIPDDGPSKMYEKRCLEFISSPPPSDWDGVYVMKTK